MIIPFLVFCILLIAALAASLFIKKDAKWLQAVILTLATGSGFFFIAVIIQRLLQGKASFVNPWALLLMAVPAGLIITRLLWGKALTPRINYSRTEVTAAEHSLRAELTAWLPAGLYAAALAAFVLALARPVTLDRTTLPPTQGIDIIMATDLSASMQKQDFHPNRFFAAVRTADKFIQKRFNDRIGLVIFAKSAMLQAPLTLDHEALRELLSAFYLGMINPDYTAIGDALGVSTAHLKDSQAKSKIIILLTDGANNAGTIDPLLAAKAAAAYGIKIYAIATASPPGASLYSSEEDEIDEGLLMEIAKTTGGQFYRAKNETELAQIYDLINQLEKTQFTQSIQTSRADFYFPFLVAGVLLLGVGLLLEKLFLIRVP